MYSAKEVSLIKAGELRGNSNMNNLDWLYERMKRLCFF
jgi:hypothetical protein